MDGPLFNRIRAVNIYCRTSSKALGLLLLPADFFFAGGVPIGAVEFEKYGGVGDCERSLDDNGVEGGAYAVEPVYQLFVRNVVYLAFSEGIGERALIGAPAFAKTVGHCVLFLIYIYVRADVWRFLYHPYSAFNHFSEILVCEKCGHAGI